MKKLKQIIAFVAAFLMLAGFNCNAFAATNSLELSDASVIEKSEDVVADDPMISGTSVSGQIIFHRVDDYAIYRFTIKNPTKTSFKILDITDDNASDYIAYEYESPAGTVIESGQTLDFDIKVIYANAPYDVDEMMADYDNFDWDNFYATRDQNDSVKFTISYLDLETGEEEEAEIVIVPETGTFADGDTASDNSPIVIAVIAGFAAIICMVAIVLKRKRLAAYCVCAIIGAFAVFKYNNVMAESQANINIGVEGGVKIRDVICGNVVELWPGEEPEEAQWCNAFSEVEEYFKTFGEVFPEAFDPTIIVMPGYEVELKFTETDEEVPADEAILDDFDVTLAFIAIKYNITYDYTRVYESPLIDGHAAMEGINNPATYTIEDEITLNQPATIGVCTFLWLKDTQGYETMTIPRGSTGDKEFVLVVNCGK